MRSEEVQGLCDPGIRRFRGDPGETENEVILLVARKGKGLVLDDRTARRESVVFVALSWGLGPRGRNEEGRRIPEGFIPVVVVKGAMNVVGAGFQDNVGCAAGVATAFGSVGGLYREFLGCVNR